VLEDEGASAALESADDEFKGDVACRAFDSGAGGEHPAFAGGFEVAVELLVDEEASDGGAGGFVGGLRDDLYVKGAGGVEGRDCFLFCGCRRFWIGLGLRCDCGEEQRRQQGCREAGAPSGDPG